MRQLNRYEEWNERSKSTFGARAPSLFHHYSTTLPPLTDTAVPSLSYTGCVASYPKRLFETPVASDSGSIRCHSFKFCISDADG